MFRIVLVSNFNTQWSNSLRSLGSTGTGSGEQVRAKVTARQRSSQFFPGFTVRNGGSRWGIRETHPTTGTYRFAKPERRTCKNTRNLFPEMLYDVVLDWRLFVL